MRYKASALRAMPTIEQGHFDDLKISTPTQRVWLSRCGIRDGLAYDNQVTVETLEDGRWTVVTTYPAAE